LETIINNPRTVVNNPPTYDNTSENLTNNLSIRNEVGDFRKRKAI